MSARLQPAIHSAATPAHDLNHQKFAGLPPNRGLRGKAQRAWLSSNLKIQTGETQMHILSFPRFPSAAAVVGALSVITATLCSVPTASAGNGEDQHNVRQVMELCGDPVATGASVREALVASGWLEVAPSARSAVLRELVAAHIWSLLPDEGPGNKPENNEKLLRVVTKVADGINGSVLMAEDDQHALLLWNGESLSCFWAGRRNQVSDFLVTSIGGFPQSPGIAIKTHTQTFDTDGRRWKRRVAFARIPPGESLGRLEDAARLDRAPQQSMP
jgi:hypothetical protein